MEHDYKVLARKYRSQTFDDLIGQDVLVQTLKNAINQKRIAHGYILTGIRGVGKTSTARIFAKALNCLGADGNNKEPTTTPCGVCSNCKAIAASQHLDVLEIDAASNTGIDNIRDIIDTISYAPVLGRYKVYIIDEVHMLSKSAFNALLKTLEEPPAHVVFILATTDIQKVPVTILSRCQRFDLPRVKVETLMNHYKNVLNSEHIKYEDEAISLIANAADGSIRDGLSLLDQGISLSSGELTTQIISDMLGLVDRTKIFDLFKSINKGEAEIAIEITQKLYDLGGNPESIIADLLDINYWIMRYKISKNIDSFLFSPEHLDQIKELSEILSIASLSRMWQMLLKGMEEIRISNQSLTALQMITVRMCYISTQPLPIDIVNKLTNTEIKKPEIASVKKIKEVHEIPNLETLLKILDEKNEAIFKKDLETKVIFENFVKGKISITVPIKENESVVLKLKTFLATYTDDNWNIEIIPSTLKGSIETKKKEIAQNNDVVNELINSLGAKIETISNN